MIFIAAISALAGAGVALLFVGLFWPGAIGIFGAAAVAIAYNDWARRIRSRFDPKLK